MTLFKGSNPRMYGLLQGACKTITMKSHATHNKIKLQS